MGWDCCKRIADNLVWSFEPNSSLVYPPLGMVQQWCQIRKIPESTAIVCLPRDSGLSIQAGQNLDLHSWAACAFFGLRGILERFVSVSKMSLVYRPFYMVNSRQIFSLKCFIHVSLFKQRWMILCMFHVPNRDRPTDWAVAHGRDRLRFKTHFSSSRHARLPIPDLNRL